MWLELEMVGIALHVCSHVLFHLFLELVDLRRQLVSDFLGLFVCQLKMYK